MNPADMAQDVELEDYKRNQAKAIMPKPTQPSATHCTDCGVRIPAARRRAVPGVQTCIECQEFNEWREGR